MGERGVPWLVGVFHRMCESKLGLHEVGSMLDGRVQLSFLKRSPFYDFTQSGRIVVYGDKRSLGSPKELVETYVLGKVRYGERISQ